MPEKFYPVVYVPVNLEDIPSGSHVMKGVVSVIVKGKVHWLLPMTNMVMFTKAEHEIINSKLDSIIAKIKYT